MDFSKKEGCVCIWSPEGAIEALQLPSRIIKYPEQVTHPLRCYCPCVCVPCVPWRLREERVKLKGGKEAGAVSWLQRKRHVALPQCVSCSHGGRVTQWQSTATWGPSLPVLPLESIPQSVAFSGNQESHGFLWGFSDKIRG